MPELGHGRLADLPVEQLTKVELIINREGAWPHGPASPLGRADEVIEY
jgi:hypothetical protein